MATWFDEAEFLSTADQSHRFGLKLVGNFVDERKEGKNKEEIFCWAFCLLRKHIRKACAGDALVRVLNARLLERDND